MDTKNKRSGKVQRQMKTKRKGLTACKGNNLVGLYKHLARVLCDNLSDLSRQNRVCLSSKNHFEIFVCYRLFAV